MEMGSFAEADPAACGIRAGTASEPSSSRRVCLIDVSRSINYSEAKLNESSAVYRIRNLSESGAAARSVGDREVCAIESVEEFAPELNQPSFSERYFL